MEKKKPSLKDIVAKEDVHTYEQAQKQKDKLKQVEDSNSSKVGRKMLGKSKATNKITFYVDDEQLEYLISLVDYKAKKATPSAVAKELFIRDYDLHGSK